MSFVFDEFATELIDGSGFDWVNDDIWAGLYSNENTVTADLDFATVSPWLLSVTEVTNKSITATGVAAADPLAFSGVIVSDPYVLKGVIFYRDTPNGLLLVNFNDGEDQYDLLSPMFGQLSSGTDITVRPRASDNGWFRA